MEIKSTFNEDEARFYLSEILLALEHLHSNSVIFRDLKPENVMLDALGHVRLIDFGLAKCDIGYEKRRTRTVCGTTNYMAPYSMILRRVVGLKNYTYAPWYDKSGYNN